MKIVYLLSVFFILFFSSCNVGNDILNDYIAPHIQIEKSESTPSELIISQVHQFSAKFFNDIGEIKNERILWESSDVSVITIDANGLAKAVKQGTATINVSAQNDNPNTDNPIITQKVTTIMVVNMPDNIFSINEISSLNINSNHQYTIIYGGTTVITWESSNSAVATINANTGLVTAVAIGNTTITATTTKGGEVLTDTTDLEIIATNSRTAIMSGSYDLSGTVTLTSLSLVFSDDFNVNTAPGGYFYLSNNPNSIVGGIQVSEQLTKRSGTWTIPLNNIGINDYKYLIFWCRPFNVYLGNGTFN